MPMDNTTDQDLPAWARDLPTVLPPIGPNRYRCPPGNPATGKVLRMLNRGICSHTFLLQRCGLHTDILTQAIQELLSLGKIEMCERKPHIGRTARLYRSLAIPGAPIQAPIGVETYVPPNPPSEPLNLPVEASIATPPPSGKIALVGPTANREYVPTPVSMWNGRKLSETSSFYTPPPEERGES